jgi:hypothetical protein
MSFGFIPSGQAGERVVDVDRQYRQDELHRRHPPSATVFAARSERGRGRLLVSEELVSFHPRRGDDAIHTGDVVQVTHSLWASRLALETPNGPLDVSVPRWRRGRLIEVLRAAGVHVTSQPG